MQHKKRLILKLDWQSGINCVTYDVFSKGVLMLSPCYLHFFFISEEVHFFFHFFQKKLLFVILNALGSSQNSDS